MRDVLVGRPDDWTSPVPAIAEASQRVSDALLRGPPDELAALLATHDEYVWSAACAQPDAAEAAARTVPRDPADLLLAAVALARGDADRAETLLAGLRARRACPPRGLEMLAELAVERNDLHGALAMLDEAGAEADVLRDILLGARPRLSGSERNAPCPCGSGRKAKRCCVALPDRFGVVLMKLTNFIQQPRHRGRMLAIAEELDAPCAVFGDAVVFDAIMFTGLPDDDEPLLDVFLRERGHRLPDDERALLASWRDSELAVVEAVSADVVRIVGTERTQTVREPLEPGELLLARILPDGAGLRLVWCVPVPRMGRACISAALRDGHIALGREIEEVGDARPVTTDGQQVLLCHRVYRAGADVAQVLDGELEPEPDGRTWRWYTSRGFEAAVVGLEDGLLEISTCAYERMAALEVLLDGHLGEVVDEGSADPAGLELPPPVREAPPPDVVSRLRGRARERERGWLDAPVPVLRGLTPRQASGDPDARAELIELLRDLDVFKHEPGGFDTDRVRDLLGLTG